MKIICALVNVGGTRAGGGGEGQKHLSGIKATKLPTDEGHQIVKTLEYKKVLLRERKRHTDRRVASSGGSVDRQTDGWMDRHV